MNKSLSDNGESPQRVSEFISIDRSRTVSRCYPCVCDRNLTFRIIRHHFTTNSSSFSGEKDPEEFQRYRLRNDRVVAIKFQRWRAFKRSSPDHLTSERPALFCESISTFRVDHSKKKKKIKGGKPQRIPLANVIKNRKKKEGKMRLGKRGSGRHCEPSETGP